MNSGAPAAHGSSGELCKRPLWQDMNPLAWRETDHSSGQFLAEQTVFGPFHGKYLLLSQGYVPLLAVTQRTETTSPSATSPTLRSYRPSETAGGPTAPSGPKSRPLAPLQPTWDSSQDTAHRGGQVQQLAGDNQGTRAQPGSWLTAGSRATGHGGAGLLHTSLPCAVPSGRGSQGRTPGGRPRGGAPWGSVGLLAPPSAPSSSLCTDRMPRRGRGLHTAGGSSDRAQPVLVCREDAPKALGEPAPDGQMGSRGPGGRARLPGKPQPLCIPEGGKGVCQLQGLPPEDHLDEALGQVPGASTRGSTAGFTGRDTTHSQPGAPQKGGGARPSKCLVRVSGNPIGHRSGETDLVHMEWRARGRGEAAREGKESPSCTAGQETPQTSPPSRPGTQTVPAEPKGRVPETWS